MGCPASLERTHRVTVRGDVLLVVRHDWEAALPLDALLAGAPLVEWGAPVSHDLAGRDRVEVLATPRGEIVAKRLSRGGVLGGLCRHTYFDRWRPAREAALAENLAARGCATPPVAVARALRRGCGWQLDLATARVAGARDLLDALQRALGPDGSPGTAGQLAGRAGRTVRRLHDAGLRHRDLQLKNLLVPADADAAADLVVLDLDRCRLDGTLGLDQRLDSLARLGRSTAKAGLLDGAAAGGLGPADVVRFFRGYGALAGLGVGALRRRVDRRLARSLAARRRPRVDPRDR